jgi:tumor protein p73
MGGNQSSRDGNNCCVTVKLQFSPTLKKIFIGINLKFPIGFSLTNRPQHTNLYIRVTPVFSQAQFFQESVHRCFSHLNPQDSSNKGLAQHILQHIIRCSNDGTRYFGDKNGTRLNLVFPLADPQVGTDVVKEFFHFVCKNSCPSGMNRRAVDVIFTLEDTRYVAMLRLLSVGFYNFV